MIARTARLVGVSPLEAGGYDADTFAAVHREAVAASWGVPEELAAQTVELLGLLYRLLAGALGGQRVDAIRIPRPDHVRAAEGSSGRPNRIVLRPGDAADYLRRSGAFR